MSATIEVLDERGFDHLSMHAIAARLGVRQPALYHHFRDKAEILSATAADVLDRWHTDRLPRPDEDWPAFLTRNASSLRRAMLAVRDGAQLVASAGPRAPQPAVAAAQIGLLERNGFTGANATLAFIAVSRYTIGAVLEQQSAPAGSTITFPDSEPHERADHLALIAEQIVALGPDHEFAVGLNALVAGLSALAHSDPAASLRGRLSSR